MVLSAKTNKEFESQIRIEGTRVIVEKLVVDDREVAEYIALSKDQAQAVVEALQLGARVLRIAGTSGDVEMVKHEFDAMIGMIGTNVEKVLTEAKDAVGKRLTEFSTDELQKSLRDHKDGLQAELAKLFGPDSANSIQKQIDKMLETQAKSYVQGLAQILERTDDAENPFSKLRKDLKDKADEAVKEVRSLRDKLLEIVSEAKGVATEREKGTAKGRTYQEYAFEEVERIARIFGDTAEYVADQAGEKGKSKAGDIVITLNPQNTGGVTVRVVFEAKNRKTTAPTMLSELDESKDNRVAVAAVAIFSSCEYVPSGIRSWRDYSGHRYVCVLEENATDPYQLEFSYRCARFDALQSIEPAKPQLDFAVIASQLKQVRGRLSELQQMRTKLNSAKDAIGDVQMLVEKHQEAMRSDLGELDRLLLMQQ